MDRTRVWTDPTGCSSTALCLKGGVVYMHTNLGWVGPVRVDVDEGQTLGDAVERIAAGYELREVTGEAVEEWQ